MFTPALRLFFRHVNDQNPAATLEDACLFFGKLPPEALVLDILQGLSPLDVNPKEVYDELMFELRKVTLQQGHDAMLEELLKIKPKVCHFRMVGDVHGKLNKYANLTSEAEYSLQVGDMGFDYRYIVNLVNSDKHKAIGGNHDNYTKKACVACYKQADDDCPICNGKGYTYSEQSKHFLGDYGVYEVPEFGQVFYVRGAWSIDYKYRTPGISWWEDEEIPYKIMQKALALYEDVKPDFVVTHTVPTTIIPHIPFERIFGPTIHGSRTEELLQQMYDIHQPKIQVFGHWHRNFSKWFEHPKTNKKTLFICLDELACLDFPKNFKIGDDFCPVIHENNI